MKNRLNFEANLRIASALADTPDQLKRFLSAMDRGFIPNSNILSLADSNSKHCLIGSCVQSIGNAVTGHDSYGRPGVFTALAEAAEMLRYMSAVGYDFSAMSPSGAITSEGGKSLKGPVNFLSFFAQLGLLTSYQNQSRVFQAAVLRVDHPDIIDFINAQVEATENSEFKLYVAITDSFMESLDKGIPFELSHEIPSCNRAQGGRSSDQGKNIYSVRSAQDIWGQIMARIAAGAHLGLIFVDQIIQVNNLKYVEEIRPGYGSDAPLPHYGSCSQGSIDLTRFIKNPYTTEAEFEVVAFQNTVGAAVEMLNQVLDKTSWPLTSQGSEALSKRKIGLSPCRVAEALEMLGYLYGSQGSRDALENIMCMLRDSAYSASIDLAVINGPFPLFDAQSFLDQGSFASGLPQSIKELISTVGIRNSHLLTGTLLEKDDSLTEVNNGMETVIPIDKQIEMMATSSSYFDSASPNRLYVPTGSDRDDLEAYCFKLWESKVKGIDEVIFV